MAWICRLLVCHTSTRLGSLGSCPLRSRMWSPSTPCGTQSQTSGSWFWLYSLSPSSCSMVQQSRRISTCPRIGRLPPCRLAAAAPTQAVASAGPCSRTTQDAMTPRRLWRPLLRAPWRTSWCARCGAGGGTWSGKGPSCRCRGGETRVLLRSSSSWLWSGSSTPSSPRHRAWRLERLLGPWSYTAPLASAEPGSSSPRTLGPGPRQPERMLEVAAPMPLLDA
mmetsp:Transcript_49885/g.126845  ORF Transcript_49885/g.126845 Transcript_49885/m.126845 type:complete len:222 (+) Transcript_49885:538-1203(+)